MAANSHRAVPQRAHRSITAGCRASQAAEKNRAAGAGSTKQLRPPPAGGILRPVSRFSLRRLRTPANGPVFFSAAALLAGLILSPLSACFCDCATAAAEASGHDSHESHDPSEPSGDHACEHDCIHLTATLPNPVASVSPAWQAGLQPAVAASSASQWALSTSAPGPVAPHHPDRGPPIPPPVHSILRP